MNLGDFSGSGSNQTESISKASIEEALRLDSLRRMLILDTAPEPCFEEIIQLAADIFPHVHAMLTLVDEGRTWIKASTSGPVCEVSRDVSLCSVVIEQDGCTVMLDTQTDPRVTGNATLRDAVIPRFYAGAPLITRDGQRVGVLCILDGKPRSFFGRKQRAMLVTLATLAADRMELRSLQHHAKASAQTTGVDGLRALGTRMLSLVPELQPAVRARKRFENDLQSGIQDLQLELHYQPEIDLNTHLIVGFEALVRWNHPTRGLLAPGEFIPVAEETGLIQGLGDWVLREACHQAAAWRRSSGGQFDLRVSVNLSPAQFASKALFATVMALLDETHLSPHQLRLEVTESILMSPAELVLDTMTRLCVAGVGLHMDDFGTGYSSLHTLHRFPFDTIKIDRSFISRLGEEESSTRIVQGIINLCKTLELKIVAEGIETTQQAALLREMGCDFGQGYYFSRPLRSCDVSALVDQQANGTLALGKLHLDSKQHAEELFDSIHAQDISRCASSSGK